LSAAPLSPNTCFGHHRLEHKIDEELVIFVRELEALTCIDGSYRNLLGGQC
jgi:hypothetical protein